MPINICFCFAVTFVERGCIHCFQQLWVDPLISRFPVHRIFKGFLQFFLNMKYYEFGPEVEYMGILSMDFIRLHVVRVMSDFGDINRVLSLVHEEFIQVVNLKSD